MTELVFKKLCNKERLFIYPHRVYNTARVIYNNALQLPTWMIYMDEATYNL